MNNFTITPAPFVPLTENVKLNFEEVEIDYVPQTSEATKPQMPRLSR